MKKPKKSAQQQAPEAQNASGPVLNAHEAKGTESTAHSPAADPWMKRIKRVAWRATAIYFWARLILGFVGAGPFFDRLAASAAAHIVATLDRFGFAPTGASSFVDVLRAGWVLAITGWRPGQIIGLFFYVLSFPVWYLFYSLFKDTIAQNASSSEAKAGLRPAQTPRPAVTLFASGLLGWYVLFGDTNERGPIWTAVFLSGLLMISLAYRAFQRARPISHADTTLLPMIEKMAISASTTAQQALEKSKNQKQGEVLGTIKINGWYRNALVYIAVLIRGKGGRNRIYAFVAIQYALFLFCLVGSAVIFWGFYIKAIAPTDISTSRCLLVSVSHFLPGVTPPALPFQLPQSASLGPGITAWILVGIYVAASGSLLPGNQGAYGQRAQGTYVLLRQAVVKMGVLLARLRSLPK